MSALPPEEVPTYRRLDEGTRVGIATVKTWATVFAVLLPAWAWIRFGPLPTGPAISLAVIFGAWPVALSALADNKAVGPFHLVRCIVADVVRPNQTQLPDELPGGFFLDHAPPVAAPARDELPTWSERIAAGAPEETL